MTETKSPHLDKSGIALFLTINAKVIFRKYLFTNLAIQRSKTLFLGIYIQLKR